MLLRLCHLVPLALGVGAVAGCASEGDLRVLDGGAGPRDAAVSDAPGVFHDSAPASDAPAADTDPGILDERTDAECFDFLDNDADDVADCAETSCGVLPICCALGSDAAACCTGGAPVALDLTSCSPGPAAACVTGATALGAMAVATLDDGCAARPALLPAIGANADSGLVLGEVLDPRVARLTLRFALGRDAGEGLARAGVGLVADGPVGARVLPLVAVERTAGALRVLVGEAEAARHPAAAACDTEVVLVVEPSGSYRVDIGDSSSTGTIELPARARTVVFGRRDDAASAWVSQLSVQRDVCNRISPERSAAPVLTGAPADAVVGRITVARPDAGALGRAALEIDGRILPATELATGIQVDSVANPLVPTGMAAAGADWAGGAFDPQLVAREGGFFLLFAGLDQDGSTAIFAQSFGPELDAPSSPVPVLRSADSAVGPGVLRIDGPAYHAAASGDVLFFRAVLADRTEIRFVRLDSLGGALADARAPVATPGEALYSDVTPEPGVVLASGDGIARDELCGARVIALGDGVVRIFYGGRRGTRWSIGALVTTDFVHFDEVEDGAALLGPSGSGFDALGVLDPEPVFAGPASDPHIVLYYTGTDGRSTALGAARQALQPGGGG